MHEVLKEFIEFIPVAEATPLQKLGYSMAKKHAKRVSKNKGKAAKASPLQQENPL